MPVPSWVQRAVFYQIFPDRFANGDPSNDPVNVQPWGAEPTYRGFQGGDLRGIIQRFDYLLDLGINAIYLNPIFMSPTNHRYHTTDYFRIDPKLGDLADFHALIDVAHRHDVRVILDGVFNHCGRGFFAFDDVMENEEDSPYRDWFHIKRFPLDAYGKGKARNYLGWWGMKKLPKFNTANPQVRRYLLDCARYWIEQGADGWRLDVPNEIDDDSFWAEFRQVVTSANPEAYTLGEIWEVQPRWANADHFDGLMNYPVRAALHDLLLGRVDAPHFAQRVEDLLTAYARENVYAHYLLLGSHDTERVLTAFEGDVQKVKLAYLFLFAYPGVPSIYYGDEIGLEGGKDPQCRRAFPWEPHRWNHDLRAWVQRLIALRKRRPALIDGHLRRLLASGSPNVYVFARIHPQETILVAINAGPAPAALRISVQDLELPEGRILHSLLGSTETVVCGGAVDLTLPAMSGDLLA